MELSRKVKILLGIGTFWPIVYIPLFIAFVFSFALFATPPGGGDPELGAGFGAGMVALFLVHMLTVFLSLGLTVFYIFHVVKNEAIKNDMRIAWIVMFFFIGIFSQPVYWYLNIWRDQLLPSREPPGLQASMNAMREAEFPSFDQSPRSTPPDWR